MTEKYPKSRSLVELSILDAGEALRSGEVTSVDLTEATIRQIERTEPRVHAYAHLLLDQARTVAAQRDQEQRAGRWRGGLHGIPLAIKDLLFTADAPTEAGSAALQGFMVGYDAAIVERLREAGAVIVGKTVTHELAYGVNIPPTRSPWGDDHYPGGSSAGSGAAVAARSAFGAIGTDTGGSIREPAALNNLVGMKPTFGRVSRYGIVPLSYSLDHAGPMTRTVRDNAIMLGTIAGYDRRDPGSIDEPVPDYLSCVDGDVRGLRIGIERNYFFGSGVWPEVSAAVDSAIEELRGAGVEVVELSFPELETVGVIGLTILLADASAEHGTLLRERGNLLDPATRVMLELGEFVPGTHYVQALRARTLLRDLTRRLYRTHGLNALISPTLPTTTVPMSEVNLRAANGSDPMTDAINATWPANVTGLPALTIPCGFSATGLPIGMQLLGRPFAEPTLYRLARSYERNHTWADRKPPLLV
jgi:aspartyl-tRNA(Asn)/glutamyl-tRNA(Gln) amidotransferase subunit A